MRPIGKLPAVKIPRLKEAGYYSDGGCLYFRVADNSKSWIFRFRLCGKTRDMGLGPYPDVSLAAAREQATQYRQMVRGGFDPIDARHEARAAALVASARKMTFDQCGAAYIDAHEAGWRSSRHRWQWTSSLSTYASPVFGELPVEAVDTEMVMRVLGPLWKEKPETASRVRGRIESVLDWAKVNGRRTGENPARWRGHLDKLLPKKSKVRKVKHHAALPYPQVGEFIADLRQQSSISARALEFLILTATRTGETLGATWDEVDLVARVWVVPPERMKSGKEHRVPLSNAAVSILSAMAKIREGDWVFPGARQGHRFSEMALLMLLRRMKSNVTAHGFRSTFRDWAAESTGFSNEVVEMALAHAIPDAVEAAYRRGDLFEKRRRLMTAWAEYCGGGKAGRKVVPMRGEGR